MIRIMYLLNTGFVFQRIIQAAKFQAKLEAILLCDYLSLALCAAVDLAPNKSGSMPWFGPCGDNGWL
jgi:hypothetical protein